MFPQVFHVKQAIFAAIFFQTLDRYVSALFQIATAVHIVGGDSRKQRIYSYGFSVFFKIADESLLQTVSAIAVFYYHYFDVGICIEIVARVERICKVFTIVAGTIENAERDKQIIAECSEHKRRRLETRR